MALLGKKSYAGVQTRIDTLIGSDAALEGDMVFAGGLRIDGRLTGNVSTPEGQSGTLMVGDQGCVDGHVNVTHAILSGRVTGTVRASGLLELHPTAVVTGDVRYGAIKMHAGAVIEGQLTPIDTSVEMAATPPVDLQAARAAR